MLKNKRHLVTFYESIFVKGENLQEKLFDATTGQQAWNPEN